ncbi:hypothetical protein N431DRAFT_337228 [Stipitochalara longipes BDJ]|nr:hypothetical protein N431DRAFT_337228 [Stipitochalara longipes BDJ]
MVSLEIIKSCNAALIESQPLVAVVTGGTSGIGEHTIRTLATTHGKGGKGLRIYIVGRNDAAAKAIIGDCLKICPAGDFRFMQAGDLSLLKDVDHVSAEIIKAEEAATGKGEKPKIDFLVMCHAFLAFEARQETKEGLDALYSLLYYSRMRLTMQLLPLLLSSPLPAHIVSVFSPKRNDKFFPNDLSLRDSKNYSFMNMGSHVAYLTTFFFESLAKKHPGKLSLSHYYPGLVIHENFTSGEKLPVWFKMVFKVAGPLMKWWSVRPQECGERVVFLATGRFPTRSGEGKGEIAIGSDGMRGGGAYRVDLDNEIDPCPKNYTQLREDGMEENIWRHTMEAFEAIEAGTVFIG